MALLFECMGKCCRNMLDTADIVREAMLRQPQPWPSQTETRVTDVNFTHEKRTFRICNGAMRKTDCSAICDSSEARF